MTTVCQPLVIIPPRKSHFRKSNRTFPPILFYFSPTLILSATRSTHRPRPPLPPPMDHLAKQSRLPRSLRWRSNGKRNNVESPLKTSRELPELPTRMNCEVSSTLKCVLGRRFSGRSRERDIPIDTWIGVEPL